MKYSPHIGVFACLALITVCFFPWVHIPSINTTLTGIKTAPTNYGSPGLLHIIFSSLAIIFFLIHKIWAKRTNAIFTTLNFAWAIRNFFMVSRCEMGECPEKRTALYLVLLFAFIIFAMSLLPKIQLKEEL